MNLVETKQLVETKDFWGIFHVIYAYTQMIGVNWNLLQQLLQRKNLEL